MDKEEPNQETLEEVAANLADPNLCKTDNWIAGARWQAERMYSEEDMIDFAMFYYTHQGKATKYWGKDLFNKWFEQFKKK